MRLRFLAVSPIYLLTVRATSIASRGRPSSCATHSAAMVLPTPGGPLKSAVGAASLANSRRKAGSAMRPACSRASSTNSASALCRGGGQDEVVPGEARRDHASDLAQVRQRPVADHSLHRAGTAGEQGGVAQFAQLGAAQGERQRRAGKAPPDGLALVRVELGLAYLEAAGAVTRHRLPVGQDKRLYRRLFEMTGPLLGQRTPYRHPIGQQGRSAAGECRVQERARRALPRLRSPAPRARGGGQAARRVRSGHYPRDR